MPNHARVGELLARWREAERWHARTSPGTVEFETSRIEVLDLRRRYQLAIDEAIGLDLPERQRVTTSVD